MSRTYIHAADAAHMTASFRSGADVAQRVELEALANLEMTSRMAKYDMNCTKHEQASIGSKRWVEPPKPSCPDANVNLDLARDAKQVGEFPKDA